MGIDDIQKKVLADAVWRLHSIIPDVMDGAAFDKGREEEKSPAGGARQSVEYLPKPPELKMDEYLVNKKEVL
ncbi:unnamed protein product [Aspergillus oryzae]|uniref:Unnamed protein product n=2 Tax=Aspergillus oryzae TaxID=5062 RepID=A0AAN4YJV6_ASPOZ|nr:unnamed protein product [Aspergillus oryzae]GMF84156.1 unnamed protein product [Aspergillus oryzae]GMG01650.1 unnamed protein product [Aspergillus oryzae]GMG30778.1 unnamed protein product [Aspergillus oryzae]GMG42384.1 unnamed protein product [Aspergillus oryzae var. brunneus]